MNIQHQATASQRQGLIRDITGQLQALRLPEAHTTAPGAPLPDPREIALLIQEAKSALFPRFFPHPRMDLLGDLLSALHRRLMEQTALALPFGPPWECDASCVGGRFISRLPKVKQLLLKDLEALYLGDPAARTREEVILCYPGFLATLIQRLAHELYLLKVPLLPRIMTEYAHEKTGIDIHAGAQIGEYFFIDHGTGVVIGETARIGNHVKLYQGVTIGARSFEMDEHGHPVKGIKRHPDIEDGVVIYAGATILGGDTVIGAGSVIGGNVWITSSVPPGSTIYYDGRATVEKQRGEMNV